MRAKKKRFLGDSCSYMGVRSSCVPSICFPEKWGLTGDWNISCGGGAGEKVDMFFGVKEIVGWEERERKRESCSCYLNEWRKEARSEKWMQGMDVDACVVCVEQVAREMDVGLGNFFY